ncbi:hypothetical protein D3C74_301050 [compost metagenome]
MTLTEVRDWQKDMEIIDAYHKVHHLFDHPEQTFAGEPVVNMLQYWIQQYVADKERADKAEQLLTEYVERESSWLETSALLAQAEEREKKLREARPIDEWHEDYGDVLWWTFPINESPYCGTPLDSDWPDYHTHWTPIVVPDKEEEA